MPSVTEFGAFFDRFRRFQDVDHDKWAAYMDRVRSELPGLQQAVRREALQSAPHFNIFRILNIVQKEAEFHTAFLEHLLDPSATHGQGLLFLECLFDCWKSRIAPPFGPLDDGNWAVRREFPIPGGILDLLIDNDKKKYVLVIENKIGTDDHDDQLRRYREWMDADRQGWNGQLVYLTPNGRCPTLSLCGECLSHDEDIRTCGPKPPCPGRCRCLSYNLDVPQLPDRSFAADRGDARSGDSRTIPGHFG